MNIPTNFVIYLVVAALVILALFGVAQVVFQDAGRDVEKQARGTEEQFNCIFGEQGLDDADSCTKDSSFARGEPRSQRV